MIRLFVLFFLFKSFFLVVYSLNTFKVGHNSTEGIKQDGSDPWVDSEQSSVTDIAEKSDKLIQEENLRLNAEARRRRREKERQKENKWNVESTLLSASSDQCDWKKFPLLLVKGQVCGVHYKVLGLDRNADKADLKRAHRAKSLSLHPDKNNAPEAAKAFKVVSDAYDCLIDDKCREQYDHELGVTEKHIQVQRVKLRNTIVTFSKELMTNLHYYVSVAANHMYKAGLNAWDLAGELECSVMGEVRPVGRAVMLGAMLVNFAGGHTMLKLHGLSYLVLRGNYELARFRDDIHST